MIAVAIISDGRILVHYYPRQLKRLVDWASLSQDRALLKGRGRVRTSTDNTLHLLVARGSLPCYTALNLWW